MPFLRGKKNPKEGYYTHLAAKWSWKKWAYVPQGVKWVGPKELDTKARREQYEVFLAKSNPYLKKVRWYDKAYDA